LLGAWIWEAPPWAQWLAGQSRHIAGVTAGRSRRHPLAAGIFSIASIALAAGAVTAWHWYQHRPKPELASFSVVSPGRTRIEDEMAKPDPLVVHFDRSAASLASAGHELPTGITLKPALAGNWRWLNDQTLEFHVQGDWPIGQTYDVKLDKSIFGPQIRLASYGFKFSTAGFAARVANVELYQDPVNPGIKEGVFDIQFTHPVDPADFERHIEVRLAGQSQGLLGVGRETTKFTVIYDKLKLNASIHSAALPVPKNPTELQIQIASGLRAARGGNPTSTPVTAAVRVPGLYSLVVSSVEPLVVDNDSNEPEQVLLLNLSAATGERDVSHAISAWVLPPVRPAQGVTPAAGREDAPYDWNSVGEVTADVLARSESLSLNPIAAEREYIENHSFRYHADVGRYVLVQVDKNLRSFGGYLSPATERFIVRVPPFPPQLKILSQGSLLALSGERKVVALVRDLPGVRVEIGRVLPDQLQHLVSQSDGDFSNPVFSGSFGPDNLVERFERKVSLGTLAHGQSHYEPIDLGEYLKGDGTEKHGLFLLTVQGYDPKIEARQRLAAARAAAAARQPGPAAPDATEQDTMESNADAVAGNTDAATDANPSSLIDKRLVLVTDLGILVKKSTDGTQDVFVQSLQTGQPVAAATVEIVAKNGTTLFSQPTDAAGRAHFVRLDGLTRERAPLFIQVRKAGDLSFLPLNRADRTLDYSRFDVGGIRNARNANEISAYLFSDRGLYRPGDTIHVGMIVKTARWSNELAGIPLESEVLDARGLTVKRERFKLAAGGFAELSYATTDTAPTGTYTVNLYIVKDNRSDALIGTTSVRVQEFEPDRMKVAARLSSESVDGWVSPKELKALINVQNLFGTAAENRRVEGSLTLTPAYPAFHTLPDYHFYDPLRAKEGYNEKLPDARTDAAGNAAFDLGLQKYARATYRVHFLARAFEPGSGRSVAADAAVLVSELPFLIGFKADGDMDYVTRGSSRVVSLIAVDPMAKKAAAPGLKLARIETQFVSVLAKQTNGTYRYESRKKETTLSEEPFVIPATGVDLHLITDTPGTYAYLIRDGSGLELNRAEYTVAGQGNVTRSLERNAELQITLNKKDYVPGEEIELSIKAPYTGSGLITIERDHVYATQWFKSDTTASVQKIRLPNDFEGNGYVSVQFIRDLASDEIFTSPLSYGIAPFMTSLAERTNVLRLQLPDRVKPGDVLHMKLEAAHPTRAVVFAVDEGILQVAHYQTPDPLGEFFKKRALEVRTSQILDLILPEFKRLLAAAAAGGDGEAALRRNLNPFKRKHDKPAVYWSGIVDVERDHDFAWTVPDSFNGTLKVFALAVDDQSIGVAQSETVARGDFVLTPNMPVAVAPGDEFEVSVGVANGVVGSGTADIVVGAELPAQLEAVGPTHETLRIEAMHEGAAVFRFRARAQLGSAPVTFTAAWQGHAARLMSAVSVRPASPYFTDILAGYFGASTDIPVSRILYPDFRKLKIGISTLPLVLVGGLADYLDDYPHLCTEQLVSRGFPALIIARRPELADPNAQRAKPAEATAALIATLRNRQNAEGGFGLWAASVDSDEFASVYAVHWLLEAREQGQAIPEDLLQRSLIWLQRYAASPVRDDGSSGLWGLRNRAYAAYLLTRQGMVTTPIIASLRDTLDARYPREWKGDVTAAYMAAAYQLQKQEREAAPLIERVAAQIGSPSNQRFAGYYDDTVRDAQVLYLLSRHFPARARALEPHALESLMTPLKSGEYNTLSSALLVLAFDAYAANAPVNGLAKFTGTESAVGGKEVPLALTGELILRGMYSGDAKKLHLGNETGLTGFFAVTNAGFDRTPPNAVVHEGMEILREYLDAQGQPVKSVKTGEEITVHLRMRAIDLDYIPNVAVTDLLPGGFELVLQSTSPADIAGSERDATKSSNGSDTPLDRLGVGGGWRPEFVDLREDRVVLYGSLSKNLAQYTYRIRATNAGVFLVPPSYAESMYDRKLRARALPASITVEQPAKP
jgi:alpha-2-macroglobulin